jgi:hypothetical protein
LREAASPPVGVEVVDEAANQRGVGGWEVSARTASTRSAAGTPPSLRVGALGVAGWDFPCPAAAWSALRFAHDFGDTVKKGSPS